MPAAAAIASIAPASPVPSTSGGGADSPDRGFRALLESRMTAAHGAEETASARAVDPVAEAAERVRADPGDSAGDVEAPLPRRGTSASEEGAPAQGRRGLALGRALGNRLGDGLADGGLALDPEALAELRARLAAGEDIGTEGLAALLSAAAAERTAVGAAALMANGAAGAPATAAGGLPSGPGGGGPEGGPAGPMGPAAGGLPDDLAEALGRAGAATAAMAEDGATPADVELAGRTTADDAARAADRTAHGLADGNLPDGAEAVLARMAEAGRGGASARAAEVADPNGAAVGLRLAGAAEAFGQGAFGQHGQGGFGHGGFGQGGFADGGAATGALPGATGAERAAAGSFAGLVQVARGGAGAQAVIDQVSVAISRAGGSDGGDRVTVQLKPASLGSIEVQLEVADDGRVQAHIVADKAETLDLLRNDARSLARALADAGLQTDTGSLNFSLKGDEQQAGGGGRGGSGAGPGLDGIGDADETAPALTETWTVADDRLDIRV